MEVIKKNNKKVLLLKKICLSKSNINSPKNLNIQTHFKSPNKTIRNNSKKIIFPNILFNYPNINNSPKSTVQYSMEPITDNNTFTQIKKIKKAQFNSNKRNINKKSEKKLIKLYKENIKKKKLFEELRNTKYNMENFSFLLYNQNLLRLSSIKISEYNKNIFRKNMKRIKYELIGIKMDKVNRWKNVLSKVENVASEKLKDRLLSLSQHK